MTASNVGGVATVNVPNVGTVSSVALAVPAGFSVTGSPVTASGTLTISYGAGFQGFTTAESVKLAGIATGATANATDAALRDRATHTGTQPFTTITGTVPVGQGGTGITSYTATNYVRALNASTLEQRTPAQVLGDIGAAAVVHTHTAADVTAGTLDLARLPVAASGVSSATQVVRADDARLSDARTPTAHTHTASQISDSTVAGRSLLSAADDAAQHLGRKVRHAKPLDHAGRAGLRNERLRRVGAGRNTDTEHVVADRRGDAASWLRPALGRWLSGRDPGSRGGGWRQGSRRAGRRTRCSANA